MKTVSISRRDKSIYSLLNEARYENLILELPDGTEFILAEIDSFDREIELTKSNTDLMTLLDERAREVERVSVDEAKLLLGLTD